MTQDLDFTNTGSSNSGCDRPCSAPSSRMPSKGRSTPCPFCRHRGDRTATVVFRVSHSESAIVTWVVTNPVASTWAAGNLHGQRDRRAQPGTQAPDNVHKCTHVYRHTRSA